MRKVLTGVGAIWCTAADIARLRPLPFAVAALALAATDLMLWRFGVLDATAEANVDRSMVVTFVFAKLIIILAWLLASLRLAHDPVRTPLLSLDRRQIGWLAALLLLLPAGLLLRYLLTKAAAPLSPDPRVGLLIGMAAYLAIVLAVQVRLMPALTGVLLGDRAVTLGWSWRATSGLVLPFIATLLIGIAPFFVIHFGNSLVWLPDAPAMRLLTLLFDGAVMAAFMLVTAIAYVALYREAKSRAGSALAAA